MSTLADLVFLDGKVYTMNPAQPCAEAVAITGDKIAKVGTNEKVSSCIGKDTKVIRLKGKTVVPGFIDTHIHVADFGRILAWIDLSNAGSIKEIQKILSKHVEKTPKEKWVLGRGWDHTRYTEKHLLTRFDLDSFSPDNPVIFYHQNGQMCVVNSKALEVAGLTRLTEVPLDGSIDRDANTGQLTGVLRGKATNLIWNVVPEPDDEELVEAAALACKKILEAGITSIHWMVLSSIELSIIQNLLTQNRLPLRAYVLIPVNLIDQLPNFKSMNNRALKIGGVIIYADGYLAAKTAALSKTYSDGSPSGKLLCTQEEMEKTAVKILKMGLQLIIHAVGDKAVDAALTTIEKASKKISLKHVRNRIEQAAVLDQEMVDRIKKQKIIVSVQPRVIASEFSMWSAEKKLGAERARWFFPLKTLLKNGITIIGGSDCPMEPLSPLMGIHAAVNREPFSKESLTVDEALCMYLTDAAYSSMEENIKGTIETEKLADLTVLSHDPRKVQQSEIEKIKTEMVVVGGRIVYSKR